MDNAYKFSLLAKCMGSVLSGLCRLLTGVQARWIGCEPSTTSRIYYANHSSHLDGLVIWSGLPSALRPQIHPVAARDYWAKTKLRRYLVHKVFRAVLIERNGDKTVREEVLAPLELVLAQKRSLIIFPEGTRGEGEQINPFKSGLYHLARKYPDVEVVPVYLENLNRALPKGKKLPIPVICSVTFGEPLAKLGEDESKEAFLQRAQSALEALVL
ncbi:bifunctional L-3-phosphoserine phosphatase/1-acyl-sn-glycerol-3-phosphate acyltransferase [Xenorhabdus mauleonii]|uniref:1-acyl-sn-glycerol-3-phosphate acyltransferases n=1 Tax=Xenorhabdus mauleonii TaxID=351675 RepID=A0A1I3U188_9GAMM|nr:lysophospholipid acyltransferase family protein [Xenorhabdus mauleonii]PHM39554.1 bifunctional L-3-phosphoserine phosphatase/1-acyl-sn-glycerol-3-phosphate acyltransferase [Xenorhabdus mauleonii]SFJ75541.1 1-acyl-sn-glycerol-3-phosphate acyltransferases [Xenorhabdus mauleonii]